MREQLELLPGYLTGHLQLTLLALLIGSALSVPLGIWITRRKVLEPGVLGAASLIQTIPGLALLAIMVPALAALGAQGIGFTPAIVALTLYSLLPILRNTVTGIEGVDPALVEAARGVGMTQRQQLVRVELPLAMPVIVAGLRTSAVWVVGTATLSTPVGAESLGNFIFSGLQTRNNAAVLMGCIGAGGLALLLDGLIRTLETGIRQRRRAAVAGALAVLAVLYAYTAASFVTERSGSTRVVAIGSKAFTEQYVLSRLIAQRIAAETGLHSRAVESLGSTVVFDALANGDVDLYVDYSGTIWATIMKRETLPGNRAQVLDEVRRHLAKVYDITLVGALGFENTYALGMRAGQARELGVSSISELARVAPRLEIGGDYEFFQRSEWAAIESAYGLAFRERRSMDPALMYQAVASGAVDVISAFSTDGRIAAYELTLLEDDRGVIPPYDAIVLASPRLPRELPEAVEALGLLLGAIDAAATAASAALPGCREGGPTEAPSRPNVLLFLSDQLRADAVGAYGDPNIETPHLDRLAAQGTRFDRALSTLPLCEPYRGMLMTGRHPTHSGIVLNRVEASPEQNPDCLGELFSRAGWHTGYLGKWHLSAGEQAVRHRFRGDPDARRAYLAGEHHLEFVPPGPRRLGFQHWEAYNYHGDAGRYWFYRDEPEKLFADGYETDILVDQAIAYLEARQRDGAPFLLVVSPHPPHPPYAPEHCPPGYLEQVPEQLVWRPNVPADSRLRSDPLPARCYYAMIRNTDDALGRLVRHMDESGQSETTLLIFTADHGEMLGSRGRWSKQLPYRESVDVPLLARWPGVVPAGVLNEAHYTPMDHLPTLCGLAGIEVPAYVDGRDLGAALLGRREEEREAALLMNPVSSFRSFGGERGVPEWRGVRTRRFTYVRWLSGSEELYDDVEDPYQLRDVAGDARLSGVLDELRGRIEKLMEKAHDDFPAGRAYRDWYDAERNLLRTALGPVPSFER